MIRLLLAALLAGVVTGPALADDVLSRFDDNPCFSRTYDAAHLASHRNQLTESIGVRTSPYVDPDGRTVLRLDLSLVDGTVFMTDTYCEASGETAECFAESDGGSFILSSVESDIQLEITNSLIIEGEFNFSPDLAQSDDRVFILHPTDCSGRSRTERTQR